MGEGVSTPTPSPDAAALAAVAPLVTPAERAMLERLHALSNQERATFVLIGHGLKTKQVAHELAISVKTAETHLARLRAKLGGANAADLTDVQFVARLWVRATADAAGVSGSS